MQLLTASQTNQLKITATAMYDALVIIEDNFCHGLDRVLMALTSPAAIIVYKTTFNTIKHTVMITMAAAFFSGVLTRQLWNRFVEWSDGYVKSCEKPAIAYATPESVIETPEAVIEVFPLLTHPPILEASTITVEDVLPKPVKARKPRAKKETDPNTPVKARKPRAKKAE